MFEFFSSFFFFLEIVPKLDGVGPVDNRPSTDELHHFVGKTKLHVTHDMWHMTCDMWHVTHDML